MCHLSFSEVWCAALFQPALSATWDFFDNSTLKSENCSVVLNPFSLLLVRSRPARVYIWALGWSWFPSEVFAIPCAPWFPTCAIKRGLQCYTRMPFTIGMVPGRRHLKSWVRVIMLRYIMLHYIVLWHLKAVSCARKVLQLTDFQLQCRSG